MTEIPPRPPAAPLADVAAAQDHDDRAPGRGDWPRAAGRQVARLLAPLAAERDRLAGELADTADYEQLAADRDRLWSALTAESSAHAAERGDLRGQLATTQAIARMLQGLAIEVLAAFSPTSVVGGVTKGDMAALVGRAQHAEWRKLAGPPPVPAPFPLGIALAALECIRQAYETGTMAHDTAHKALDDAEAARRALRAALEPPVLARPEAAAPGPALSDDDRAQVLYGSYRGTCAALPGKFPPPWDKLPERERTGWRAAARTAFGPLSTLRAERDSIAAGNARLARIVGNDSTEFARIVAMIADGEDDETLCDIRRMARAALKFGEAPDGR